MYILSFMDINDKDVKLVKGLTILDCFKQVMDDVDYVKYGLTLNNNEAAKFVKWFIVEFNHNIYIQILELDI